MIDQVRSVNFGKNKSNLSTVGYTLLNSDGSVFAARAISGVYQLIAGSGQYAAFIRFPVDWHGTILWDTGEASPTIAYANEQYNVEENDPIVKDVYAQTLQISSNISFLRNIEGGRWKIYNNQMTFYAEDNLTVVAVFDLFDINGTPTMDQVAERRRA
jgi:hypothetical protein